MSVNAETMKKQISRRQFLGATRAAVAGGTVLAAGMTPARAQSPTAPIVPRRAVLDDVEVLVVGGGPAGIGAALGAARKGAQTLLIENHAFFGGVAAWSMGMQMNQMRPGGSPRSQVHELLIEKLKAYGDQAIRLGQHEVWCNVEYLKVAVLDALDAVGCRYLVHIRAADAVVEGNRVTGVVVATKRGLQTIRAKVVVDCTGDADVAFYAGAETMIDKDVLMPMTLGLTLTNIDKNQVRPVDVEKAMHQARNKYPLIPSGFIEVKQLAHGSSWWINHAGTADLGRIDPTNVEQRTKAECFGRRQTLQMVQALRDSDNPTLRQIEWSGAGPQMSVRESRRVKGVYVITEEDAMAGRTFDDTIAWRSGFLDLGGQKGGKYIKMQIHDVPYRAILPEKLDGLLTAGRCISATHAGAAAGKSMGNCMATGHAAGVAGALGARNNYPPREVRVAELQAALHSDGVNLNLKERGQKDLR
jgi:ribulose 1,5-bisphosphate synthetase/thiazole synthase